MCVYFKKKLIKKKMNIDICPLLEGDMIIPLYKRHLI